MASLKEVKQRIVSVENTKKITTARQMISSAQLHRAQGILENIKKYNLSLETVMSSLKDEEKPITSSFCDIRETGAIAVVIMASNSGMCGAFNARMIKEIAAIEKNYAGQSVIYYPIGKKIREALQEMKRPVQGNFDNLAGKSTYQAAGKLATNLMDLFLKDKVKQIELVYYHNKTAATQEIKKTTFLPYMVTPAALPASDNNVAPDYIFEPSREVLFNKIMPLYLQSVFYVALADNQTAEHAARTVSMQLATENAENLLRELKLSYNKLRQQNITAELLDIIGGTFA